MELNLDSFFVAFDKCLEAFDGAVKVVLDGTFPHCGDAVTRERKFPVRFDVANDIIREFLVPEFRIALGLACKLAAVLVPKTAVYEDHHAVLENE